MRLDILHSPWRSKYVARDKTSDHCVFCHASQCDDDQNKENLVVHKGKHAFVIMNLYPYNNGHVMVVPHAHEGVFHNLDPNTLAEMSLFATVITQGLTTEMNAQGFNIGYNIGKAGGAGIPSHIHMHVLPRWSGDTNFTTTLGDTRVISQSIEHTFEIVKSIFDKYNRGG